MSSLVISEARKEKVIFSTHYAQAGKSILTTKANITRIYQTTGFNDESVKLVALKNSISKKLAKNRLEKASLTPVDHYEDGLLQILSGETDGMVADLAICELAVYRDTTNELTLLKRPIGIERIAIAMPKDALELQKEINQHLLNLSENKDLENLHKKWFSNGEWLALIP